MLSAHGVTNITFDSDIIYVRIQGCFNAEGVEEYIYSVKAALLSFENRSCSILVDDTLFDGCTPEGFELLQKFNLWQSECDIVGKAFIISSNMHKSIIQSRIPSLNKINTQFFEKESCAIKWIKKQSTNG